MQDPRVDLDNARPVADDLTVVENLGVDLVPNIGLIGGTDALLVVDTGIGTENAGRVLEHARRVAAGRALYLTTTHFHPEHAFGAQVFAGHATYVVNRAQALDLATKTDGYLAMFRGLDEVVAGRLEGVEAAVPDLVYDGDSFEVDLGGRVVRLIATGRGHSAGDQVILVPDAGVLFTGDLVEEGQFPIFPFFPPHDTDVSGADWLTVLDGLIALEPRVVVPGHGSLGDAGLLEAVRGAILRLRDETARLAATGLAQDLLVAEITATLTAEHPDWRGAEWIPTAVASFLAA